LWEVVADAALDRPGGVDAAILADPEGSIVLDPLADRHSVLVDGARVLDKVAEGRPYAKQGICDVQRRMLSGKTSRPPLGYLDLSKPMPDVRTWRSWEPCDPRGEEEFKRHSDEWDRQLREIHAGQREHLKTWNQLTYDLGAMTRDEHGRLRLDCKLGTYYHSLSTSECLDAELSEAYAAWPDATPEFSWPRLERRAWLHERVPDPVADGRHRSAAGGTACGRAPSWPRARPPSSLASRSLARSSPDARLGAC
jgi:hypothetical protein